MMLDVSLWLEATALSRYLNTFVWLWPTAEVMHFIGLALLIGGAGMLDLRLLGAFRGVPIQSIRDFMPWAIGGFVVNLITGVTFIVMAPQMYLSSGIWWAKVSFLALAGLNAFFFETRLSATALALGPDEDTPLAFKLVGGCSLFSWFAVLYCGRMLPYLGTGN
jgi:hypothetical protein